MTQARPLLRMIRNSFILGGSLFVALLGWSLGSLVVFNIEPENPYESSDICFLRDEPGTTSRFIQYTPVLCSNPRIHLGNAAGADYGKLRFEDVDGDAKPEAIVESSAYRCRYGSAPCYDARRIVLKVCASCESRVAQLSADDLPDLTEVRKEGDAHGSFTNPQTR